MYIKKAALKKALKNNRVIIAHTKTEDEKEVAALISNYVAIVIPAHLYNQELREVLATDLPELGKQKVIDKGSIKEEEISNRLPGIIKGFDDPENKPIVRSNLFVEIPEGKKKKLCRLLLAEGFTSTINEEFYKVWDAGVTSIKTKSPRTPVYIGDDSSLFMLVCSIRIQGENVKGIENLHNILK